MPVIVLGIETTTVSKTNIVLDLKEILWWKTITQKNYMIIIEIGTIKKRLAEFQLYYKFLE